MPNFMSVAQRVSEIWTMQYFDGHLGVGGSDAWGPKFLHFVFGTQVVFVLNFKSVA